MTEELHRKQLRAAGLRATPGRMHLLHMLEKSSSPLTIETLTARLPLNAVTVYRALESLTSAGLVLQGSDGRVSHYSYALKPHHHHLKCTDCSFIPVCRTC